MRDMSDDTIEPKCRVIRNVMIPMRDGVKLATMVLQPAAIERLRLNLGVHLTAKKLLQYVSTWRRC